MEIILGAISVAVSIVSAGVFAVVAVVVIAVAVEWVISKVNGGE